MKLFCKTNLIIFVFLAGMLVFPALSQASNLLGNPGFESPTVAGQQIVEGDPWFSTRGDENVRLHTKDALGTIPGPEGNQVNDFRVGYALGNTRQVISGSGWSYNNTFSLSFNATNFPGHPTSLAVSIEEGGSTIWSETVNLAGLHPGDDPMGDWTEDMAFDFYIHPVDFPETVDAGSDLTLRFIGQGTDDHRIFLDNVYLGLLPVALTANPESQEVVLGDPVEFTVDAVADAAYTISYQWYFNEEALAGEESDTLSIAAAQGADAGSYYCEVTFDDGIDAIAVNSSTATLDVDLLTDVTTQPESLLLDAGENAVFSIAVDPETNVSGYQWYWSADGEIDTEIDAPIGHDANSVTIENVQVDPDEGYYYCEVTVDDGAGNTGVLYSDVVTLGIARQVAYWTLDLADYVEGEYLDSSGEGRHATPFVAPPDAAFVDGILGDALDIGMYSDAVGNAGTQSPSEFSGEITVSCWVYWNGADGWQGVIGKRDGGNETAEWQIVINPQGDWSLWAGTTWGPTFPTPSTEQWVHLAFTVNDDGAVVYLDGLPVADGENFQFGPVDAPLVIGAINWRGGDPGGILDGLIDDVRIYNYAFDAEAIGEIYFELADVVITEQPQDQAVFPGEDAEFSLTAVGEEGVTLNYQWYRSDDDTITPDTDTAVGTDSNSVAVDNIALADEGYYYCVVSPDGGGVAAVSNAATLGVKRLKAHWTLDEADYEWFEYLDQAGEGYDLELWEGIFDDPAWIEGIVGDDAVPMAEEQGWARQPEGTEWFDFAEMTGMLTVSAWINWDGYEEGMPVTQQIVNQQEHGGGWSGTGYMRLFVNQNGTLVFGSPPTASSVNAPEAIEADGNWQYVVATYDGDQTGRLYVNGVLVGEDTFFFGASPQEFHLGGVDNNGVIQYFNGAMDEVRVYNYELDWMSIGQTYTDVTGTVVCADPPPAFLDLYEDCVIDTRDLAVLVNEWLDSGFYGLFVE